jgi:hypothetical protein
MTQVAPSTAIEMIFHPNRWSNALLYLPFDSSASNSASAVLGAASYSGGLIFDTGCKIGTGAVQIAEATKNWVHNPSFEVNVTDFWTAANVTACQVADARVGNNCVQITGNDVSSDNHLNVTYTGSFAACTQITISGWCKVDSDFTPSDGRGLTITAYDGNGVDYAGHSSDQIDTSQVGVWQFLSVSWQLRDDHTHFLLRLYLGEQDPTKYCYWDGIQVEAKSYYTPYCDGSLGEGHAWAGTAHNSTSTRGESILVNDHPVGAVDTLTVAWWYNAYSKDNQDSDNNNMLNISSGTQDAGGRIFISRNIANASATAYTPYFGFIRTGCVLVPMPTSGCVIPEGEWHHYTLTASGLTTASPWAKMYLDGVFIGSATAGFDIDMNGGEYMIGNYSGYTHYSVNGWIDEFLLFGHVLTADEISGMYTAQSGGHSFKSSGGIWTDVSTDVIKDVRVDYGIRETGPLDRVGSVGTLNIALRNDDLNSDGSLGYYSPDHANARDSFDVGTDVRVKIAYSGSTRYKWRGKIDDVIPVPGKYGPRKTKITAVDWFDIAAKSKVALQGIQFNVSADTGLDSLVTSMSNLPPASSLAAGQDSFPTIFDSSRDESTAVTTEFHRLVMSELGYLYLRGTCDIGSELVFEDRHTRAKYGAAAASMGDTCLIALDLDRSSRNIFNKVKVEVSPREIDASASVLFTLQSTPLVAQSGSIIIEGRYTDPVQRGTLRIGGASMVDSASDTDYKMWTASDGSGTDLTGNFSVTACYGGNTVRYEISNDGTQAGYITLLQARGRAVAIREPSISEKVDQDSIAVRMR